MFKYLIFLLIIEYAFTVIRELDKYRAQAFQIGCFGFMTPLGRLVLRVVEEGFGICDLEYGILLLCSLLFAAFGILLLFKGGEHLAG